MDHSINLAIAVLFALGSALQVWGGFLMLIATGLAIGKRLAHPDEAVVLLAIPFGAGIQGGVKTP